MQPVFKATFVAPIVMKQLSFVVIVFLALAGSAQATVLMAEDWSSRACDSLFANVDFSFDTLNGVNWDGCTESSCDVGDLIPPLVVKCAPLPNGKTRMLEASTVRVITHDGIGPQAYPTTWPVSVSMGTTYYFGGYFRYERKSGLDIWHDSAGSDSYNKLIDIVGPGFRWGLGVGWPAAGGYTSGAYADHKFTFDVWCGSSTFANPSNCDTTNNWDHKAPNQNGYSVSNAFQADYERWYAVIAAITAQNSTAGRVRLWINGTLVTDRSIYTADSGSSIVNMNVWGTVAQPAYDAPIHKAQLTGLIVATDPSEVAAYMSDPEAGSDTTPPAAPMGLTVQ